MDRNSAFNGGKAAYICLAFGGIFSDLCRADTTPDFRYSALPNFPRNETDDTVDPSSPAKAGFHRRGPSNRRLPSELSQIPETLVPASQNPPTKISSSQSPNQQTLDTQTSASKMFPIAGNKIAATPVQSTQNWAQRLFPRNWFSRETPQTLPGQNPPAQLLSHQQLIPQTPATQSPNALLPSDSVSAAVYNPPEQPKQSLTWRSFLRNWVFREPPQTLPGQNPPAQLLSHQQLIPQTPATQSPNAPVPSDYISAAVYNPPEQPTQSWVHRFYPKNWFFREPPQTSLEQNQQNQFTKDLLGFPAIRIGTPVSRGQRVGAGAFGAVYAGSANGQDIVIKQSLFEEGRKDMQKEWETSKGLVSSVMQNLGQKNPEYGLLYGMGVLVPVLAVTEEGNLIQTRIPGATLDKTIIEGRIPYDTLGHFPRHLQEALARLTALYLALVAIHNAGYAHSDIKPDNIMLADKPMGGDAMGGVIWDYPLYLIDFGIATPFGGSYSSFSPNGGPECVLPSFRLSALQSLILDFESKRSLVSQQIEDLKRKNSIPDMALQIKESQAQGDLIAQLKEMERKRAYASKVSIDPKSLIRLQQLTERQEFLSSSIQTMKEAQQSIVIPPAHPSYDIYATTPVALAVLFGEAGLQLGQTLFFHNPDRPIKFQYVHDAGQPGFDGHAYFLGILADLNRKMLAATGQGYPEPILERLAHLLAGMADLDPMRRLSAVEIVEALTDMALSDWEHGFFSIQ
ncbi:MAG: hypothetical protein LBG09_00035 [Puniceicoccales bacterium]|jgi:serine/threonine protein kinase|nr:hypothetical protein [Puniceicoccales bacterium]